MVVADYGAFSCQVTLNLMRGRTLEYATNPAITYTRCYAPVILYYFFFIFSSSRFLCTKYNHEYLFDIKSSLTTIIYFANTTPINRPAKRIPMLISTHHRSLRHLGIIISPSPSVRIDHDRKSFFTAHR